MSYGGKTVLERQSWPKHISLKHNDVEKRGELVDEIILIHDLLRFFKSFSYTFVIITYEAFIVIFI